MVADGKSTKLFSTTDIAASIRKAYAAFTHVLVNRGYTTIKPAFFRSNKIADLPIYVWASWEKGSDGQLAKWRDRGGVLIHRSESSHSAGPADVLVFVECSMTMKRIKRSMEHITEYGVIPKPHTWIVHEQAIDLRSPEESRLRLLWDICHGQRLTDLELAEHSGLPRTTVMYQRCSFKRVEEWQIKPRLKPDAAHFLPAWDWLGTGRTLTKKDVGTSGHKLALLEMARLGHVALTKYQQYGMDEPDWKRFEKKRQEAIEDLRRVRSLVESLPDHQSGSPPSDVSPLFAARSRGKAC
jgi:hypothetical protein